MHSFTNFISKTDLSQFGGLREDAEENFAISADRKVEALAKFFTSTQPQTHSYLFLKFIHPNLHSIVFEMSLKHKKALFLKCIYKITKTSKICMAEESHRN